MQTRGRATPKILFTDTHTNAPTHTRKLDPVLFCATRISVAGVAGVIDKHWNAQYARIGVALPLEGAAVQVAVVLDVLFSQNTLARMGSLIKLN